MPRRASTSLPPPLTLDTSLFLDVDGTLLDIAPTPDGVVVPKGLVETLNLLHAELGGAVALVSGRRRAELRTLFRDAHVVTVAEHGATASVPLPAIESARHERVPLALVATLRRFAARHPDTLVEIKAHGAALHVRRAPAAAAAARQLAEKLAVTYGEGVRLLRGKAVFEFIAASVSKGRAIEALLQMKPFAGRVPYVIGDDVTDEDGFAVANRCGGTSLRVGSSDLRMAGSIARYTISRPSHLRKWLCGCAERLRVARLPNRGNLRAQRTS
jgi:trehalose 6-phosphate phosphatase